jgi:methionyl-tRNA synthetase
MLMAAEVPLPQTVWAHGYIHWGGRKLSKSAGAPVTLEAAIQRYGPDPLRYFLLREVPWNGDADFTWQRFDDIYTAELANDLGNLANRALGMINKYRGGKVPNGADTALDSRALETLEAFRRAMDGYLLHQGAARAMALAGAANGFIEESAPWALAKDPSRSGELDAVLGSLARSLGRLAVMLSPFMPNKSQEMWQALGGDGDHPGLSACADIDLSGQTVLRQAVLFPKPEA